MRRHSLSVIIWGLAYIGGNAGGGWLKHIEAAPNTDPMVLVESVGERIREASPGALITTLFQVSNKRPESRTYVPDIQAPEGWRIVTSLDPLEVPGQSAISYLISFQVPKHVQAGTYPIRFGVQDRGDIRERDHSTVYISISPRYELDLRTMQIPDYVVAGSSYQVQFLVENKGNVHAIVELELKSHTSYKTRLDSSRLHVPVQEARTITAHVDVPEAIYQKTRHQLILSARVLQVSDVWVESQSRVQVIPKQAQGGTIKRDLPIMLTLSSVGGRGRPHGQVEVKGSGTLVEGALHEIDFLFRAPNTMQHNLLGDRDEYRIGYRNASTHILLGDQVYALSPLTEAGRFGFGVQSYVAFGNLSLGGFLKRNRQFFLDDESQAVKIGYRADLGAGSQSVVSTQFLDRSGFQSGKVWSLRNQLSVENRLQFDSELGISSHENLKSSAYRFELTGTEPWINYNARYLFTGPGYSGYYRDVAYLAGQTVIRPFKWLQLRAAMYQRAQGFDGIEGTLEQANRFSRRIRLGPGFTGRLGRHTLLIRLNFETHHESIASFDREARTASIELGYSNRKFGFKGTMQQGRVGNLDVAESDASGQYRIQMRYGIGANQISASVEHRYGPSVYFSQSERYWLLHFGTNVALSATTHVKLTWLSSIDQRFGQNAYNTAYLDLEQMLFKGHLLKFTTRYAASEDYADLGSIAYQLSYVAPIGIPVVRQSRSAHIVGRVFDPQTGQGVKDALVHLGKTSSMTGDDGTFVLPKPHNGRHYLLLDRLSIGLDRIPTTPMPLELNITDEVVPNIEIGVLANARLQGEVVLFTYSSSRPEDSAEPELSGGLSNALVEIRSGSVRYRRLTDAKGRFTFPDLSPGTWIVEIIDARAPQYHQPEKKQYSIQLRPGEEQVVMFKVVPRKRRIRMLSNQ